MPQQKLITKDLEARLARNGRRPDDDHVPVLKLFYPAGAATWLITHVDGRDPDILWGLCDLGQGCPEHGPVRLSELQAFTGRFGLGIERDAWWKGEHPLSVYQAVAREAGRIVERPSAEQVAAVAGGAPRP